MFDIERNIRDFIDLIRDLDRYFRYFYRDLKYNYTRENIAVSTNILRLILTLRDLDSTVRFDPNF